MGIHVWYMWDFHFLWCGMHVGFKRKWKHSDIEFPFVNVGWMWDLQKKWVFVFTFWYRNCDLSKYCLWCCIGKVSILLMSIRVGYMWDFHLIWCGMHVGFKRKWKHSHIGFPFVNVGWMWDLQKNWVFVFIFGTESVIWQSNAYGGGGEVAAKQRCNCFQVFLQI